LFLQREQEFNQKEKKGTELRFVSNTFSFEQIETDRIEIFFVFLQQQNIDFGLLSEVQKVLWVVEKTGMILTSTSSISLPFILIKRSLSSYQIHNVNVFLFFSFSLVESFIILIEFDDCDDSVCDSV
jgi:hypothetical protein